MTVALACPACAAPLGEPDDQRTELACDACHATYPVRLGIVDLRGTDLRVAGADFDAAADLAEATELAATFQRMSYREWFFGGVDRKLSAIDDPKWRRLMTKYYRDERTIFGLHGDAILAKLDAFLAAREPARFGRWRQSAVVALEAGCGTGQYPIGFAKRFAVVLVTDISYVSLVQARKIAEEFGLTGVRVFASNIELLPLPTGSVDFVHCNGVIEHVADPERAVAECGRVLSADGVALVLSPNKYSLYTEAHFRVPGFGFWPMPARRWLARRASGARSFSGTELRSLGDLKRYARIAFPRSHVYMLPPRLRATARSGAVRGVVRALLALPIVGRLADLAINRVLLGVMPYQVLVGFKR